MDALRLQWVGSDFIEDSFFPRKTAERPVLDCMDALSNSTPYYSSSRILPSKPGSGMVIAVKRFIQEVFQDYNDSNNSWLQFLSIPACRTNMPAVVKAQEQLRDSGDDKEGPWNASVPSSHLSSRLSITDMNHHGTPPGLEKAVQPNGTVDDNSQCLFKHKFHS
ncbi:hypothetical protein V6N11_073231 [Hibiscus sabdariffa]|uniref:Uncharacterized protein n=1 Tax=Hibiscus sabdariffa TaxID=183260 RepID=A0ABR2A573_9ROSI